MKESSIQEKVTSWCKPARIRYRKLSWGEGWPDYIFLYKGNVCFIEFKKPGEEPSKLQAYMIAEFQKMEFFVWVIDDPVEGIDRLERWKHAIDAGTAYRENMGRIL